MEPKTIAQKLNVTKFPFEIYDNSKNLIYVEFANGYHKTFNYNDKNQLESIIDSENKKDTYTYYDTHTEVKTQNSVHESTTYTSSKDGQLLYIKDHSGNEECFISEKDYQHSKFICSLYERHLSKIEKEKAVRATTALTRYFETNLLDNHVKVVKFEVRKDFSLDSYFIYFDVLVDEKGRGVYIDEDYEGQNDEDILALMEPFKFNCKIHPMYYGK